MRRVYEGSPKKGELIQLCAKKNINVDKNDTVDILNAKLTIWAAEVPLTQESISVAMTYFKRGAEDIKAKVLEKHIDNHG